jgi:hypothetical protein
MLNRFIGIVNGFMAMLSGFIRVLNGCMGIAFNFRVLVNALKPVPGQSCRTVRIL